MLQNREQIRLTCKSSRQGDIRLSRKNLTDPQANPEIAIPERLDRLARDEQAVLEIPIFGRTGPEADEKHCGDHRH